MLKRLATKLCLTVRGFNFEDGPIPVAGRWPGFGFALSVR